MSSKDLSQRNEAHIGYILVDLDRTLAHYSSWNENGEEIGPPVPAMVERVIRWRKMGHDIRIFTARAGVPHRSSDLDKIRAWCKEHLGFELPIQNWKDFGCVAIWDDLAVGVEGNTGLRLAVDAEHEVLTNEEEAELIEHSVEYKLAY